MTVTDPAYPGQMGDSLLDRVTRLPFVIPGDPTGVPASVLLALAPVDGADDLAGAAAAARPLPSSGQVACPGCGRPTETTGSRRPPGGPEEVASTRRGRVLGRLPRLLPVPTRRAAGGRGLDGLAPLIHSPDEVAGSCGRPCASSPTRHHGTWRSAPSGEEALAARKSRRGQPRVWVDGTLVWVPSGIWRVLDSLASRRHPFRLLGARTSTPPPQGAPDVAPAPRSRADPDPGPTHTRGADPTRPRRPRPAAPGRRVPAPRLPVDGRMWAPQARTCRHYSDRPA